MFRRILPPLAAFCRCHPALAAVAATLVMLLIPAAITPFNTKGEPREAIVALSMLMSGDWILPVSFGADIPYKPPFLAWLIAVFSLPAGHVTEFTSRLPSIIACACLAATVASFVSRDTTMGPGRALAAALITVTSVEVWRSGGACRVDMVLTAAIAGACVVLYRLAFRPGTGRFLGAVTLMTVAVLTKGPVGVVLPCLIIAVWACWARLGRKGFIRLAALVSAAALLSLVIPAWWYAEAYARGGERFLDLALEENFGRMTGTMSYASHLNPWWYNLQTLAAGLLPYTLLLLLGAFAVRRSDLHFPSRLPLAMKLAVTACLVTLVFYTIPASKRSVYLLPMYPFLAVGIAALWDWLLRRSTRLAGLFSGLIRVLAVLVAVALLAAPFQPWLPGMSILACWACSALIAFVLIVCRPSATVATCLALIVALYSSVGIAVLPPVMAGKSDRAFAREVESIVGPDTHVWELITHDPLLRYYTAGFYLADRIRPLPSSGTITDGWLLTSPDDAGELLATRPDLSLTLVEQKSRSCDTRRPVALYKISRTGQKP